MLQEWRHLIITEKFIFEFKGKDADFDLVGVVCESDRSVKVTNIGNVKEIRYLLGKMTYFSFQLCLVV